MDEPGPIEYELNGWYGAALSSEIVSGEIKLRHLLGAPVILYRSDDGKVVASAGMCPHRFAPLDKGKLLPAGVIECGYHGLKFDIRGKCIFNPRGEGAINARMSIRSYATLERYGVVWIWGGEAEKADPELMPKFDWLEAPAEFATSEGYIHGSAHYQLVIDNLLDASHADYLHPELLTTYGNFGRLMPTITQQESSVTESYEVKKQRALPVLEPMLPRPDELVDQKMVFTWHAPAVVEILASAYPEDAPSLDLLGLHILTPGRRNETHYWFRSVRNFGPMNADTQQMIQDATMFAFVQQDKPMLEGVSDMMDGKDFWDMKPAVLEGDTASILVRRLIKKRITAETQASRNEPALAGST